MPWQAAALAPLQPSSAGARWIHLSVLPCFLLHLYATKRHLLLSPIKKRCVWQQAQPLGQPHIYLGNCYYLALGSGFLLKPQFPITRVHRCACRDVVLPEPISDIWQNQKEAKQTNERSVVKNEIIGPSVIKYYVTSRGVVSIQHAAPDARSQGPAPAVLWFLLHFSSSSSRKGTVRTAVLRLGSDQTEITVIFPIGDCQQKAFDRSWSCVRMATWSRADTQ